MMENILVQVKFLKFKGGEDKIIRIWKNSANIKFTKISGHSAPIRSL